MTRRTFAAAAAAGLLLAASLLLCAPAAARNTVKAMSLDEFKALAGTPGTTAVVVAMAAWCGPCRAELPDLIAVYAAYKDKGLTLYGASLDFDGPKAIQSIVDRYGVPFPVYWLGEPAIEAFAFHPIPMTLVFRDGEIVKRVAGKQSKAEIEALVREALAGK